ncbi:MAG: hypothetical protein ACI9JT_000851 [Polaribacter sp.]|jgi:hypothetical protein
MTNPNFFIVGAPKCGTTALFRFLENHPQVFLSDPKEVNFFSKKELEEQRLYYQDFKPKNENEYLNLFKNVDTQHKIIGEASVSYLYYPEVAGRIHSFNPDSKIVILLRDPVARALSHYLMDKRLGLVNKELVEIFHSEEARDKLNFQQYFLLGNYASQVKKYLSLFGKNNVKIFFSEELKSNRNNTIQKLYRFLGIQNFELTEDIKHNAYKEPKGFFLKKLYSMSFIRKNIKKVIPQSILKRGVEFFFNSTPPTLNNPDKILLKKYYYDDICELEKLLTKDLTEWK